MGIVRHVADDSTRAKSLSEDIGMHVCDPLEHTLPELEATFKQLQTDGTKNIHEYKNSVSKLEKACF